MLKEESFGVIPIREINSRYQVFLVQIKSGYHWGFPKGHSDSDKESSKEIARRELKEETNLDIATFISDKIFSETYKIIRDNNEIEKTAYYFPVSVIGEVKLQKDEVLNGGWFDIEEAIDKITFVNSKNICKLIPEFIEKEIKS